MSARGSIACKKTCLYSLGWAVVGRNPRTCKKLCASPRICCGRSQRSAPVLLTARNRTYRSIAEVELLLPRLGVVDLFGNDERLKVGLVALSRKHLDDEPPGPRGVLVPILRVLGVDVTAGLFKRRS